MRRDLDLIRKMVLAIEDAPTGYAPPDLQFDGYSKQQVGYHAWLLMDAGLARGDDVTALGADGPEAVIFNLTWDGHEFAAAARDESSWTKAMGEVARTGGAVTLPVLSQLLISFMKSKFGLQ